MIRLGTGLLRRFAGRSEPAAAADWRETAADSPRYDPERLETLVPPIASLDERVAMAVRCRDSDPVPKVPGAGRVSTLPDGRRVQLMHNGVRVLAGGYHGDWMLRLIEQCRGHHEPQEELVFHEIVSRLPPGGTMLELGGFWAFYSIWFLHAAAGRRALLVEPDPAHMAVGRTNLALNGVEAEFIPGFFGSSPGETRPFTTEDSGTLDLPCLDVAGLLAARGIERLTILHCDIQGAEFDVLRQSAELLRERRVDWVLVSTHHHIISGDPLTHQRCLALLLGLGAVIEAEHDVQESFSGDGLICARFGPEPPGWRRPALSHNRASHSLFRNPLLDLAAAAAAPRPA